MNRPRLAWLRNRLWRSPFFFCLRIARDAHADRLRLKFRVRELERELEEARRG